MTGTWLARNWFLIALIVAVALAVALGEVMPNLDPDESLRRTASIVAVVTVFVLIGMALPTEQVLPSLARVRVHLFIQLWVFVFIPLLIALFVAFAGRHWFSAPTIAGLYAVAVIPTTGSSCVVFTQASGGNVVTSTANSAIANVIGIVVSPLALSLLLNAAGRSLPLEQMLAVLRGLALRMLAPLIVGQIIRAILHRHSALFGAWLGRATASMIVIIVFLSASTAMDQGLVGSDAAEAIGALVFLAIFHLVLLPLIALSARAIRLRPEDRIAAVYTGSQKTLALGAPLIALYFADEPVLIGSALIPLIFYHLWQLVVFPFVRRPVRRVAGM